MAKARSRKEPAVTTAPAQDNTETKRERFERIGTARMNRVLHSIRLIGNLANSNYEWSEQDILTIQTTIVDTLAETLRRFDARKKVGKPEFHFGAPVKEDA